jgi:hypothetical protein
MEQYHIYSSGTRGMEHCESLVDGKSIIGYSVRGHGSWTSNRNPREKNHHQGP